MSERIEYFEWLIKYLPADLENGLRVGQSYIIRVRPKYHDPELFYERDAGRCHDKIIALEIDWQGLTDDNATPT